MAHNGYLSVRQIPHHI